MCSCGQTTDGGRVITSAQLQAAADAKQRVEEAAQIVRDQATALANARS